MSRETSPQGPMLSVSNAIPEIWDGAVFHMDACPEISNLKAEIKRLASCLSQNFDAQITSKLAEKFKKSLLSGERLYVFEADYMGESQKPIFLVFVENRPYHGQALAVNDFSSFIEASTNLSHAIANIWAEAGENAILLANSTWEDTTAFRNTVRSLQTATSSADQLLYPPTEGIRSLTVVTLPEDFNLAKAAMVEGN